MKTKMALLMGSFLLATFLLIVPGNAFAQLSAPVNILSIAQSDTELDIRASHTSPTRFQNVRFIILNTSGAKNAQLAILLTAMSTGKPVNIVFTQGTPNVITNVQIINN